MPTRTASAMVSVAVHRLPSGPIRRRYEDEFIAELYGLRPARQLRHSLGVLFTAGALNHAVGGRAPTFLETTMNLLHPAQPWGCRLNLHHHWEWRSTDDGARYMTCGRCGKDRSGVGGGQAMPTGGTLPGGGGGGI